MHAAFYLSPNTLSIGLIGPGTVGRVLLAQIATQIERLRALNLDLRVRGIASSKRMLLEETAVDLERWPERLAEAGEPLDLEKFANHVQADYIPHTVIIDCTASAEVADQLSRLADARHSRRHAQQEGQQRHAARTIARCRRRGGRRARTICTRPRWAPGCRSFRRCATCARPAMTSRSIEGIFSGTLAYLFNVFDGSETFSSIVRAAKAKGYTEPDPRDDLSGWTWRASSSFWAAKWG